jgi:MFS family permease
MKIRIRQRLQTLDLFATRGIARHYRKGMRAFWLDSVFASISGAFLLTYVPLYALAFGATNTQIGSLSSTASLLSMLAPIPGAQLTEKWGSRRKVVTAVWSVVRSLSFLLLLIPFFVSGQAAILAVIVLWSLRAGLANLAHPAWVSLSGDIIPPERRGRFFSSRNMAMALCSMAFVPLAGQIIDWAGEPQGYQWSFGLSALFGYAALYFYAQIPESTLATSQKTKRDKLHTTFKQAFVGNRTFLLFTLIAMLWNFSLQLGGPFFSVFQVKELGTTPGTMGWLSMVMSVTGLIGQFFWGRIVDRRNSRWVLAACALSIPILPFIWYFLSKPWHAVFVRIPSGFLWAGFNLASFNLQLELSDPKRRTQAAAGYTTLIGLANIVGPIIGSTIVDTRGYYWDFALSGLGRLVGGILFVLLLKPFAHLSRSTRTSNQEKQV